MDLQVNGPASEWIDGRSFKNQCLKFSMAYFKADCSRLSMRADPQQLVPDITVLKWDRVPTSCHPQQPTQVHEGSDILLMLNVLSNWQLTAADLLGCHWTEITSRTEVSSFTTGKLLNLIDVHLLEIMGQ